MLQTVRVTSKRQITIPSLIYHQLGLKKGQSLVAEQQGSSLILTPNELLIEKLAGSVKIPKRFKNLSLDQIIAKAKTEYFSTPNG